MTAVKSQTEQVSARVPREIADYLKTIATSNDRSLAWVVSYALKQWVAGQKAVAQQKGKREP